MLPSSKTSKYLFSTYGAFEETGPNLTVIIDDLNEFERGASSIPNPRNHTSLGATYFQSLDKQYF